MLSGGSVFVSTAIFGHSKTRRFFFKVLRVISWLIFGGLFTDERCHRPRTMNLMID